ncbi:MAG: hypothetical protein FWG79_05720 [Bacteroidales bacterium]|nr:hypothetical protein [Bacteroidales bacterium]
MKKLLIFLVPLAMLSCNHAGTGSQTTNSEQDSAEQNLSFMGITLGEELNLDFCDTIRCISESGGVTTYAFNSQMEVNEKNLDISCEVHSVDGIVTEIVVFPPSDYFYEIVDLYREKYDLGSLVKDDFGGSRTRPVYVSKTVGNQTLMLLASQDYFDDHYFGMKITYRVR